MDFKIYKEPQLRDPYMVTGLPGIGYVAKISADYLIEGLKAELFEELYSPAFPPYVLIGKDGTVELLRNEFYYWKNERSKNDLIIFTGNVQALTPEGQYEVAKEVLNRAERFKVKKLFTMAAYVTNKPITKPKVYGAATHVELLEELKRYGVIQMDVGGISGTNGLIFGLAKLKNIPAVCLLSETPGYVTPSGQTVIDQRAAQSLLEVLCKVLEIEIDLKPMEERVKFTEELIRQLEEREKYWREVIRKATTPTPPKDIYF